MFAAKDKLVTGDGNINEASSMIPITEMTHTGPLFSRLLGHVTLRAFHLRAVSTEITVVEQLQFGIGELCSFVLLE